MLKHFVAVFSMVLLVAGFIAGRGYGERALSSDLLKSTYFEVCRLVDQYYVEDTPHFRAWVNECRDQARLLPKKSTLQDLIANIQTELPKLPISHLDFWDPSSSHLLWDGVSHETGIRARNVAGHWIVFDVVADSPAARAKVEVGDELLACDAAEENKTLDAAEIRFKVKSCKIKHDDSDFTADLRGEDLQLNLEPEFFEINAHAMWIKMPSFLSPFYDGNDWKSAVENLSKYGRVVLDVRGNGGGYFVTMLKALSPFFCKPQKIGSLLQPRKTKAGISEFGIDSSFEEQNDVVDSSRIVQLKTYAGYACYSGEVRVLMDNETASTAEIFSSAFRLRPKSKLMGQRTEGAVVLASWFPLPLGTGYRISIPQAMFESPTHQRLEGTGLIPDIELTYLLSEARAGDDSWVLRATEASLR